MALASLLAARAVLAEPAAPSAGAAMPGTTEAWAALDHYRQANATLTPSHRANVVFIGDSITESWALEPVFTAHPEFIGRGISGQTTPQMLVRFYADVIALQPAVVHIMAGTNDVAENTGPETDGQIESYIEAMALLARAHGIRVVLASIPPTRDFPWRPGLNPSPRIRRLNDWIRAYAAHHHLIYADYWHALASPDGGMNPEMAEDGVHPNPRGYAVMLPVAEAAITSVQKDAPSHKN
jgi:lysophospholipase L1-like esterase